MLKPSRHILCASIAACFAVLATTSAHAISTAAVAPGAAGAATLVNNLVGGSGITVVGTPTLTGGSTSAGTFTSGLTTGIGINSGIVLTSGSVGNIGNTNTSSQITTDFSGGGDTSLDTLVGGGTQDATVLTFSFTSSTGNLFFRFAFASEEYNEYVGTEYNDVFGFFVDGVNIALIPSTTTPIAINTVNTGLNSGLYKNNSPGPYAFEYDGFTTVFTVSALGLSAGTHTIKLAIADRGDRNLDSGVFLEGGSFQEVNPPSTVPDSGSSLLFGLIGFGALFALHRRLLVA